MHRERIFDYENRYLFCGSSERDAEQSAAEKPAGRPRRGMRIPE